MPGAFGWAAQILSPASGVIVDGAFGSLEAGTAQTVKNGEGRSVTAVVADQRSTENKQGANEKWQETEGFLTSFDFFDYTR